MTDIPHAGGQASPLSEASLDGLIHEITVDARDEDEQHRAFRHALCERLTLPAGGTIAGAAVSVLAVDYDGSTRRGITAKVRRDDGSEFVVTAADVMMPDTSEGTRYLAAYRRWMTTAPPTRSATSAPKRKPAAKLAIDTSKPVELKVLSVSERAARCRLVADDSEVTLRSADVWHLYPGAIAVVTPNKHWIYNGRPYLSGEIESVRFKVQELGLIPLKLEEWGVWNPAEHYWGEEDEPLDERTRAIISRGCRPQFRMEQILPRLSMDDDPIVDAVEREDDGDGEGARRMLMNLCYQDLRCLDAHAHLGNLEFKSQGEPREAIRHFEAGFRIGELSLGANFDGVLPWAQTDNQPFLRCMRGYGLCLWRLGRFDEALEIFERVLWLNPPDNQGVRLIVDEVVQRLPWQDRGATHSRQVRI